MNQPFAHRALPVLLAAFFVLCAVLPSTAAAVDLNSAEQNINLLEQKANESKGMVLAILKSVKRLNDGFRSASGSPIRGSSAKVNDIVTRITHLKDAYDERSRNIESLIGKTDRIIDRAGDDPRAEELKSRLIQIKASHAKNKRIVKKYYDEVISDFGEPVTSPEGLVTHKGGGGGGLSLNGDVSLGMGASSFKRPNANPEYKASSFKFQLGLNGTFKPASRTLLSMRFSHDRTTELQEISLTRFGLGVNQGITRALSVRGAFDIDGYSDRQFDINSYTDIGFLAGLKFNNRRILYDTYIKIMGRGYGDLNNADYSVFTFDNNGRFAVGDGNILARLKFQSKSNDIETLNNSDFSPSVVWQFDRNGSELGVEYQKLSHPEVDDSPLDENRLKTRFILGRSSGTSTRRFGMEFSIYTFPNMDADFRDITLFRESSGRGDKYSRSRLDGLYRIYSNDEMFDFAQLTYRLRSTPIGSGWYHKFNFSGRYYTESSEDDDSLATGSIHDPHRIDVYFSLGYQKTATEGLKRLSLGPIVGGTYFIDTERDEAFEGYDTGVDYLWENPLNIIKYGLEGRVSLGFGRSFKIDFDVRWITSTYYNADPIRSITRLEYNSRASYQVAPKWVVDGYANVNSSRANTNMQSDLTQLETGFKVRYLFEISM